MFDDQDGCEWVKVSSGTGPPGQYRTKGHYTVVCVCVRVAIHKNAITPEKLQSSLLCQVSL